MSKPKKKVAKKGLLRPQLIPTQLLDVADRERFETADVSQPHALSALSSLLSLLRLGLLLLRSRTAALTQEERAQQLRRYIEKQGGIWIKVGQLLSFRRDLLPQAYIDELSRLQDRGAAFPWEAARTVIEEALGGPIDCFFSEIQTDAIGVGSIGQVHRGRLREEGISVAVKVKRPHVDTIFRRDLALFNMIAKFFERLGIFKKMRWADASRELEGMVLEELDYRLESDAAGRMHKSLLNHAAYAPKVFFRYCTTTTIVLEFIEGVKMTDYIRVSERDPARVARWCAENRVKPKRVAYRLFSSLQRQIFEDNLFHADLHPGNIMLFRNSRFGLIDFGAVGELEGTFREQLNQYYALVAEGFYIKAAEIYLDMSSPLPALSKVQIWDVTTAIAHYQRNLSRRTAARTFPHNQKYSAEDDRALRNVAVRYKIPFPWQWLKLQRTLFALDSSLFELDKKANTIKFGVRYRAAAARRQQSKASAVAVGTRLSNLLTSATTVIGRVEQNLAIHSRFMRRAAMVTEPMTVQAIRYFLKAAVGLALVVGCTIALRVAGSSALDRFLGDTGRWITENPSLRWILWGLVAVGARILYTGIRGIRSLFSK